jgi:hypothetical protein
MPVRPKLMMGAGIAIAGLGLIGAGAGATFTAQVAGSTSVTTGRIGLSLNGRTGRDVQFEVDGSNLGTHFTPISRELRLTNTGTLDIASSYLDLTAAGCDGGVGAPLARSLRVTVTDVTHSRQVYDGGPCSAASALPSPGDNNQPAHSAEGGRLPYPLRAGDSILYEIVFQPNDPDQGLAPAAQNSHTSVKVVFTGYDY